MTLIFILANTCTWYLWRDASRVSCSAAAKRSVRLITIPFAAPTAWRTATSASWRSRTAAAGVSSRKSITECAASRRRSRKIISTKLELAYGSTREKEREGERRREKRREKKSLDEIIWLCIFQNREKQQLLYTHSSWISKSFNNRSANRLQIRLRTPDRSIFPPIIFERLSFATLDPPSKHARDAIEK